ncbi:MAG: SufD family Fe-S cluster assembly protein [Rhizomicrobium sp.]
MTAVTSTLDARRAKARESFRLSGVPNRRVEDWKYTDLHNAVGANDVEHAGPAKWSVDASNGVELFDLASADAPDWVKQRLGSLGVIDAMDAASLAFSRTGFAIRMPKGQSGEAHVAWQSAGQARVLIVLEDNASLNLIETGEAFAGFRNIGVEVFAGSGAALTQTRISPEDKRAVQVADISVKLGRDAICRAHFANFGAKVSRTGLHIALEGEGAQAHLSGVSVLKDAHADVTVHMDHAVGNTQSTQLFKYVAGGRSRGVYQGKVTVREGANGSDSRQAAKGLLLEDRAEIDLKPELEILADDVKCAHGAAVGDLDAESLFYLRSRGLPEAEARALLMRAFLGDAVEQIADEAIRASVWQAVEAALETVS